MFEFGRKMAAARRKAPGNDIITQLAFEPLTQREFDVYFVLLATAGNETTRHTITHGLLALLEHPDQLQRLRETRSSTSPRPRRCCAGRRPCTTSAARRRRRRAGGVELPAGAKVTTWFVSGNRDETVFEDPDTFDVGRTPNKHMAFGPGGIHHCMGAHLARMEIKIAFEELLKRVATIELAGEPERLRSNFFNGIKRLPVRVTR
jgi:cytochrome P450